MAFTMALYPIIGKLLQKYLMNIQMRSGFIRLALILAGCYGAYTLGATMWPM